MQPSQRRNLDGPTWESNASCYELTVLHTEPPCQPKATHTHTELPMPELLAGQNHVKDWHPVQGLHALWAMLPDLTKPAAAQTGYLKNMYKQSFIM